MGCFISLFKSPEQDDTVSKARKQTKRTKEPEKRDKSTQQNAKGKKPESNAKDAPILIAVVGRTGSGLSQFIHDVTGSYKHGVAPAASLQRHTNRIQEVTALIKEPYFRKHITLIDTPGFDYSRNNDERATFKQLAKWLRKRYGSNAKLDGVIYMHNIWNEELYHRSPFYTSDPLEQLCGRDWRKKVILVNSHWDEGIGDDGMEREDRLRSGYWSFMSYRGSPMVRYESPGDRIRAREILNIHGVNCCTVQCRRVKRKGRVSRGIMVDLGRLHSKFRAQAIHSAVAEPKVHHSQRSPLKMIAMGKLGPASGEVEVDRAHQTVNPAKKGGGEQDIGPVHLKRLFTDAQPGSTPRFANAESLANPARSQIPRIPIPPISE